MEQLFFDLIRVAIGSQKMLSRPPSTKEWQMLYDIAKKQSLVGVCFAGVQRLCNSETSDYCGMSEMLYLTWMGMAAKIQQRNEVVNRQCVELQAKLSAEGIRSSVLKGQGVAGLYSEHLRGLRQSGDIDIYVDCGREKAIEYARSVQGDVDWDYKHLHLNVFPDTEVEVHYVPNVQMNLYRNKRLQEFWDANRQEFFAGSAKLSNGEIITPSRQMSAFYVLHHAYMHLLTEGVGLRQVMDCYFALNMPLSYREVDFINHACRIAGMKRFMSGLMYVLQMVFGMPLEKLCCAPNPKEGEFLLQEIMTGGNFGHHDERLLDVEAGSSRVMGIKRRLKHVAMLWRHYPLEMTWVPVYTLWHFVWKRIQKF